MESRAEQTVRTDGTKPTACALKERKQSAPSISVEAATALQNEIEAATLRPPLTAIDTLAEAAATRRRGKGQPPGERLLTVERALSDSGTAASLCRGVSDRAGDVPAAAVERLLGHWSDRVAGGMKVRTAASHVKDSLYRRTKAKRARDREEET